MSPHIRHHDGLSLDVSVPFKELSSTLKAKSCTRFVTLRPSETSFSRWGNPQNGPLRWTCSCSCGLSSLVSWFFWSSVASLSCCYLSSTLIAIQTNKLFEYDCKTVTVWVVVVKEEEVSQKTVRFPSCVCKGRGAYQWRPSQR